MKLQSTKVQYNWRKYFYKRSIILRSMKNIIDENTFDEFRKVRPNSRMLMKNNKNKALFLSSTSRFRKYFLNSCARSIMVYIIAQIAFFIDRSAVLCTHIELK